MIQHTYKIIYNPVAGYSKRSIYLLLEYIIKITKKKKKDLTLKKIKHIFTKNNCLYDVSIINENQNILQTLCPTELKKYKAIIIAGGDGTIYHLLPLLSTINIPIGIIPTGSVNILAKELNISSNIKKACEKIIYGSTKKIDIGKTKQSYFSSMLGIGFDAEVIRKTCPQQKKKLGVFSFALTFIHSLMNYNFDPFYVTLDNTQKIKGYYMLVGNSKYYAGPFKVFKKAKINDGLLNVCILTKKGPLNYLIFLIYILFNKLSTSKMIHLNTVKALTIENPNHLPIHCDAEYYGTHSEKIQLLNKKITMLN